MTLDCLKSPKLDFTENLSSRKIIQFQQSQALTSHFESFWSIVNGFDDSKLELRKVSVALGKREMEASGILL